MHGAIGTYLRRRPKKKVYYNSSLYYISSVAVIGVLENEDNTSHLPPLPQGVLFICHNVSFSKPYFRTLLIHFRFSPVNTFPDDLQETAKILLNSMYTYTLTLVSTTLIPYLFIISFYFLTKFYWNIGHLSCLI